MQNDDWFIFIPRFWIKGKVIIKKKQIRRVFNFPVSDWLINRLILIGRERHQVEHASKAKKLYKENRLKRLYDPIHRAQKSNYVIFLLRNNWNVNFLDFWNKIGIYRAKCVTCGEIFYEKRKFVKSQCKTCEMKYCENCWRESKRKSWLHHFYYVIAITSLLLRHCYSVIDYFQTTVLFAISEEKRPR